MITFFTIQEAAPQPEIPEWMREERYMYCDQAITDRHSLTTTPIWEKIKKVFS